MRADMGGAATTLASALAIARLKLPLDLIVATPMTENMPGGGATKPGDVYVVSCILSFSSFVCEVDQCRQTLCRFWLDADPSISISVSELTKNGGTTDLRP